MRNRISPATVIACVALFFSLTGAGMAATGYRITSIFQIAPKVRHELRGARGLAGPQGVAGPAGPAGPQGAAASAPTIGAVFGEGDEVTIAPGATGYASAQCPEQPSPSYWLMPSGGYFSSDPGIQVFTDTGNSAASWLVGVLNPTSQPVTVQAWVACMATPSLADATAYASKSPNLRR